MDNLLTSDNPVIATDNWKQIMLPISPNILIEFQEDSINSSNNIVVILEDQKTKYVNVKTRNYLKNSERETNSQRHFNQTMMIIIGDNMIFAITSHIDNFCRWYL